MKFQISRDHILKYLQKLSGVVEKRQTLPVLGNLLVRAEDNTLMLAATDLEVELIARFPCTIDEPGEMTLPARKWLDICRNLSEDAELKVSSTNGRATIQSGKSRFTLSTLPATEFPLVDELSEQIQYQISQGGLKSVLDGTHFSMAQQDVRYYLNGLMMEMTAGYLRCVATDGHRLALMDTDVAIQMNEDSRQIIVPRKGIQELMRLLSDSDDSVTVSVSNSHIRITVEDLVFTSKLIDGNFPDYARVLPQGSDKNITADKERLRQTLSRVAILSNEKYRGVRILLKPNAMQIMAHNPEQEEAEDEIDINYKGAEMEIGFNANYLLDAINAVRHENVLIKMGDTNSSCIIQSPDDDKTQYVVMPMRL